MPARVRTPHETLLRPACTALQLLGAPQALHLFRVDLATLTAQLLALVQLRCRPVKEGGHRFAIVSISADT